MDAPRGRILALAGPGVKDYVGSDYAGSVGP